MACRPACGPAVSVYSTLSGPTMAGSKTHPLAKCQLRRAPRMLWSMLIDSFSFHADLTGLSARLSEPLLCGRCFNHEAAGRTGGEPCVVMDLVKHRFVNNTT